MVLILVESSDAFRVNDEHFVLRVSLLVFDLNRLIPDPEALKSQKEFNWLDEVYLPWCKG